MPVEESKIPKQGLRLKAVPPRSNIINNTTNSRTSTRLVGATSSSSSTRTITATTSSSKATTQKPQRPTVLRENSNSNNLTGPLKKVTQPAQLTGRENQTPALLPEDVIYTLKQQKQKRTPLLSGENADFWFIAPNVSEVHVDNDTDSESNQSIDRILEESRTKLPTFPTPSVSATLEYNVTPTKIPSPVRSALSLPGRRLNPEFMKAAAGKSVRFAIGPDASPKTETENVTKENVMPAFHTSAKTSVTVRDKKEKPAEDLEIEDYIETIKQLRKLDIAKLEKLLQELKQEELAAVAVAHKENIAPSAVSALSQSHKPISIKPTPTPTLNPRVPDFQSKFRQLSVIPPLSLPASAIPVPPTAKSLEPTKATSPSHSISTEPPAASTAPAEASRAPTDPPKKPRKRAILDDPSAPGRQVAAFETWYAERQLIEFMKKYPLTGKKADAKPPVAEKKAGPELSDKGPEEKVGATAGNVVEMIGVKAGPDMAGKDVAARALKEVALKVGVKKRKEMLTRGPVAGRHAAMIQQRLEFLLWKEKEKKALERRMGLGL
jgi:hypothetical protein